MRENSSAENEPIPELPDDLNSFADQLGSFKPRSIGVDRDQLLFAAGQASARQAIQAEVSACRRSLRIWQSAALIMMAVSAGLGSAMIGPPDAKPRLAFVGRQQPPHPSANSSTGSVPNDQKPPVVVRRKPDPIPTWSPIEVRKDFQPESTEQVFHAFEGLRSRQFQIAQMLDSRERFDGSMAGMEASASSSNPTRQLPSLTPRSLLRGAQSRIWINRLIEEPQL